MGSLIISSLFMFIFFFFKEEEEEEEEKNRKLQLKNKPNDSNETTIKISACHAEVVWGRGGGERERAGCFSISLAYFFPGSLSVRLKARPSLLFFGRIAEVGKTHGKHTERGREAERQREIVHRHKLGHACSNDFSFHLSSFFFGAVATRVRWAASTSSAPPSLSAILLCHSDCLHSPSIRVVSLHLFQIFFEILVSCSPTPFKS